MIPVAMNFMVFQRLMSDGRFLKRSLMVIVLLATMKHFMKWRRVFGGGVCRTIRKY